jgi:1-acyl-sn-glycerol-3-phosphate acyltransferase
MSTLFFRVVTSTVKHITHLFVRVHMEELVKVPAKGPLLAVGNHINFIEAPVMYSHLQPRPCSGMAKIETWDNWFTGWLFSLWGAVPVHRGELDLTAFKLAKQALDEGKILAISPEGTRSGNGALGEAHQGIIPLALKSGAPLMPMVWWGNENYKQNIKRLRRSDFNLRVGNPFKLVTRGDSLSPEVRKQMVDEIMFQLSALLPPQYRGIYADLNQATEKYLEFEPGVESNLIWAT